jgi:hypothetical protein
MKVDSTLGDTGVPTQAPPAGVLDELSKLLAFARQTISAFLELISLEARRAVVSLVWMIVGGLIATIFIVTAWAGVMGVLAMFMITQGMLPLGALLIVVTVNLLAGVGLLYWCIALSRHMLFGATRRQIAGVALIGTAP